MQCITYDIYSNNIIYNHIKYTAQTSAVNEICVSSIEVAII
jgi:hypothetical protein